MKPRSRVIKMNNGAFYSRGLLDEDVLRRSGTEPLNRAIPTTSFAIQEWCSATRNKASRRHVRDASSRIMPRDSFSDVAKPQTTSAIHISVGPRARRRREIKGFYPISLESQKRFGWFRTGFNVSTLVYHGISHGRRDNWIYLYATKRGVGKTFATTDMSKIRLSQQLHQNICYQFKWNCWPVQSRCEYNCS